jgi:hypothetical protein
MFRVCVYEINNSLLEKSHGLGQCISETISSVTLGYIMMLDISCFWAYHIRGIEAAKKSIIKLEYN